MSRIPSRPLHVNTIILSDIHGNLETILALCPVIAEVWLVVCLFALVI